MNRPILHNRIFTGIGPLETVSIQALKPSAINARRHSKQQIRLIARSIETFGFVVPMVVDAVNEIICGNAVYQAVQLLGLDHVRVVRVTHLDKDKLRAFQIAHNRIAELSSWDDQLLGEVLQEPILQAE
jgi:ParB-like chromosome segregation protein Spo0J